MAETGRHRTSTLKVPGEGEVRIPVTVFLSARRRSDGHEVSAEVPALPQQTLELPEAAGTARVSVEERAEADNSLAYRMTVEAQTDAEWLLYEAALCFRIPGDDRAAIIPSGWGREISTFPPDFEYEGNYPGWSCHAQIIILQGAGGGVSLAARDPALELKYLRLTICREREPESFSLQIARVPQFIDGAWKVQGECDVLLSSHASGWETAAKNYRLQQEKVRPELRSPHPLNPLIVNDPFWLTHDCFAYPPHTMEHALRAIAELNAPVLIHIYNWAAYEFDTHYPDLLASRDGADHDIKTLTAAGASVIPYLNARLWDTTLDDWPSLGRNAAAKDPRGEPLIESYAFTSNIPLGVACPSRPEYRRRVTEACLATVRRHALKGVYLDQCGAAFGMRCYAENHHHPPGGAISWNDGQRAMLADIRACLETAISRPPLITTENASEPLVDLLDGFLYWCGRPHEKWGRPVPLWQAIYGDFGHSFADNFGKGSDNPQDSVPEDALRRKLALQAVFGASLGWLSPALVIDQHACSAQLMRNARTARLPYINIFRNGIPLSEALDSTGERVGVLMSAWKSDTRTVALAVNPTTEHATFPWPDGSREDLPPLQAAARTL